MLPSIISLSPARPGILLANEWRRRPDVRHLYIHIPFCHRRCAYCDFNTYANMEDRMEAYVATLCAELRSLAHPQRTISPALPLTADLTRVMLRPTIFLGGGTPSMLPEALMERTLAAADGVIPLCDAEVTVECNPGTVLRRDYLRALRAMGVNRISLGVQSLHDPTLRVLGRIHTAAEAYASFNDARAAGFKSINLDFIFGLPGQTIAQWEETLREIVSWGADHFALYSLILEERTPLYAQVSSGRVCVPDDDATGAMYELAIEHFAAAGYVQYEISNWARNDAPAAPVPSHACHHNLAYWLNADYLAAGAGAHGHLYPHRYVDVAGIDDYITRVRAGNLPVAEVIDLTPRDLAVETIFMGLRLNAGVSFAHFRDRCGMEMDVIFGAELGDLAEQGLIERDERGVRLTDRGRMLGNRVFERFV
ncbi:radical SAM family heme chaperone HemW [Roseiflexus sp.]|uniref:radical SAM family heme chaperone HemW n=1 Tax=Roseiflexus sp. TaxID=2562120 RepID=UPI002582651D|nr:radical SAM family heme chaperone HemW [Roseiflexus sp.]